MKSRLVYRVKNYQIYGVYNNIYRLSCALLVASNLLLSLIIYIPQGVGPQVGFVLRRRTN